MQRPLRGGGNANERGKALGGAHHLLKAIVTFCRVAWQHVMSQRALPYGPRRRTRMVDQERKNFVKVKWLGSIMGLLLRGK